MVDAESRYRARIKLAEAEISLIASVTGARRQLLVNDKAPATALPKVS